MESKAPAASAIRLQAELIRAKALAASAQRRVEEAEGAKDLLRTALEETTADLKSARERVLELQSGAELSQELAKFVLGFRFYYLQGSRNLPVHLFPNSAAAQQMQDDEAAAKVAAEAAACKLTAARQRITELEGLVAELEKGFEEVRTRAWDRESGSYDSPPTQDSRSTLPYRVLR